MSRERATQVVSELRSMFGKGVALHTPFPKPYCNDASKVRAIYLGCDPTNRHSSKLPYAFALESNLPIFKKFLVDHTANLQQIGLSWNTVYAQNLCQNYFGNETSKNLDLWRKVAGWWTPRLKTELLQFADNIPVLLTSGFLYDLLVFGKKYKPIEFYECRQPVPIPAEASLLDRPLIPFYRHFFYSLTKERWRTYRKAVRDCID